MGQSQCASRWTEPAFQIFENLVTSSGGHLFLVEPPLQSSNSTQKEQDYQEILEFCRSEIVNYDYEFLSAGSWKILEFIDSGLYFQVDRSIKNLWIIISGLNSSCDVFDSGIYLKFSIFKM